MPTNPKVFSNGEANFLIDGPSGYLELLTQSTKDPVKGVAVICHPHPLHQGTMHNKVVSTLARAFLNANLHAVRFNFRGVGQSEGCFDNSIGEVADLMAVLHWVDKVLHTPPLWLAGFSFGAYIAAKGATQHACQQLYSVAPAVTHQPFQTLGPVVCPWEIIQGDEDEVIPAFEVTAWYQAAAKNQPHMSLHMLKASHFFHGNLIILRDLVTKTMIGDK
ncbi:MAG: alpha/beta hydrolase [Proteobacteria bacterium]|nr:alpha/beta hydrolase [Pseudomonadota bacterium]